MTDQPDTQLDVSTHGMEALGQSSPRTLAVSPQAVTDAHDAFQSVGECMAGLGTRVGPPLDYGNYHGPALAAVEQTVSAFARTMHGLKPLIEKSEKFGTTSASTISVIGPELLQR